MLSLISQTLRHPLLARPLAVLLKLRNRAFWAIDVVLMAVIPVIAFLLRTESLDDLVRYAAPLWLFTLLVLPLKSSIFIVTRLYNNYWPYAGEAELRLLSFSVASAVGAECLLFYGMVVPLGYLPVGFPRSMALLDGGLTILFVGGTRLLARLLGDNRSRPNGNGAAPAKRVLIAGAGTAGLMVTRLLQENNEFGLTPAGFVDDDPDKIGKLIRGLKVLGPVSRLADILRADGISQVIIAMPSASGQVVRDVVIACEQCDVESRTVPGLLDLMRGTARVEQFRNIQLEDLLRRGALRTDASDVAALIQGKRVMVTGAGGSIGAEVCRQVLDHRPSEIVLVGHGENSIFAIARELKARTDSTLLTIAPVVADVRILERMRSVFSTHLPDIVFHAAAHKHVGLMERNITDAVTNNILGTKTILECCLDNNTERFVMISSDKAVNPTSAMGVTKRVAELLVRSFAWRTGRRFTTVRFGNVLGSRGSVVPIFERQIENGGPITVTHPEVRRYFMTIPEAVQLVLQAATMGEGGEVFVLDMGEQIRVADLARDIIRLHGLREGRDVRIVYTGLTPGEKMSEELFYEDEQVGATAHDKIRVCRNGTHETLGLNPHGLDDTVSRLFEAAGHGNEQQIVELLRILVPQFSRPAPFTPAGQEQQRKPERESEPALQGRPAVVMEQTLH